MKEEERRLAAQREAERRKAEQEENLPAIKELEERVRKLHKEVSNVILSPDLCLITVTNVAEFGA